MKEALLWDKAEDGYVQCRLCSYNCRIKEGTFGFCSVRKNIDGSLFTYAYGKVVAENADPVEKKPLFHFLPGSSTYSIATIGCNFRCGFCQNWSISQNAHGEIEGNWGRSADPQSIVSSALEQGCKSISFTYTEPTIFLEYALDTMKIARDSGLKTVFVSNGYMSAEALEMICPYLDACNIDLKAFTDDYYRKFCKASLAPVLESLKKIHSLGIWLEITTLVIPEENDSEEELGGIASFIAEELDKNIPWHVSKFFPQYELTDHPSTPASTIQRAKRIGEESGLRYVYAGNLGGASDTVCPVCGEVIIHRSGYRTDCPWMEDGRCKTCGAKISGVWK